MGDCKEREGFFGRKILFYFETFLSEKISLVKKNFWVKKKFLVEKKFGSKNILVVKIFLIEKFLVKNFWVKERCWVKKIVWSKYVWSKKLIGSGEGFLQGEVEFPPPFPQKIVGLNCVGLLLELMGDAAYQISDL